MNKILVIFWNHDIHLSNSGTINNNLWRSLWFFGFDLEINKKKVKLRFYVDGEEEIVVFFFWCEKKTDLERRRDNFLNEFVLLFRDLCYWNFLFVLDMNLGGEEGKRWRLWWFLIFIFSKFNRNNHMLRVYCVTTYLFIWLFWLSLESFIWFMLIYVE